MSVVISVLLVLVMLGVLSTAHELGHFFVAKLLKVKAYEVSIFVGPVLFKWHRNGVDYSIRCIPIGAYVRFSEIDDEGKPVESDDPSLLINQPRWRRLIIAVAGPLVNLFLGMLIFFVFSLATGYTPLNVGVAEEGSQLYGQEYTPGDKICAIDGRSVYTSDELSIYLQMKGELDPVVLTLKSEKTGEKYDVTLTPAITRYPRIGITRMGDEFSDKEGWELVETWNEETPVLKKGDVLLSIDGHSTKDSEDASNYLSECKEGEMVHVVYLREGLEGEQEGDVKVFGVDTVNALGTNLEEHEVRSFKEFLGAAEYSLKMPLSILRMTGVVISNAFKGEVEAYKVVSGPVGVVNVVDTVVSSEDVGTGIKVSTLVMLAGMISVALTISNLLPLPGLDGSQIIILVVEMVIGRRLPRKAENIITIVGFFVLIGLVILAFASDIAKIIFEGW